MAQALTIESVPLIQGDDGVILVAGTRVPLDTVVKAFQLGATAEEIAQQYPTVPLGVVYQVVGYYLQHRSYVEEYLARREEFSKSVQADNESRWPAGGIRARLLARRK